MRIAFDLDNTLIPCNIQFPTERQFPTPLFGMLFPERFRKGTRMLLKTLHQQGHEIWIYTTSQRPPWYLKLWFWCLQIPLHGVINLDIHRRILKTYPSPINSLSKYPPAFRIDILIDDSEGVVFEGQRYGFSVIRIDPHDIQWTERISRELYEYGAKQ